MLQVFAFGNEYVQGDEVAKEIAKNLKFDKIEFILAESPNEILKAKEEILILDVVKGLKQVSIIDEIDDLVLDKSLTCHDLDLGFYLKLLKESAKISSAKIIGIPFGKEYSNELLEEVKKVLEKLAT